MSSLDGQDDDVRHDAKKDEGLGPPGSKKEGGKSETRRERVEEKIVKAHLNFNTVQQALLTLLSDPNNPKDFPTKAPRIRIAWPVSTTISSSTPDPLEPRLASPLPPDEDDLRSLSSSSSSSSSSGILTDPGRAPPPLAPVCSSSPVALKFTTRSETLLMLLLTARRVAELRREIGEELALTE